MFGCSCCPPNIVRFIPSIGNLIYTYDENTIYVNQFMECQGKITIGDKTYTIEQKTSYPYDSKVSITVSGGNIRVAVRVPSWCDAYDGKTENGYLFFKINDTGSTISLDFHTKPRIIYANPRVMADAGKCALSCGAIVFCMEGQDNQNNIKNIYIDTSGEITIGYNEELKVPTLVADAYVRCDENELYTYKKPRLEKTKATLIPYYAFANRGVDEMQVWHLYK